MEYLKIISNSHSLKIFFPLVELYLSMNIQKHLKANQSNLKYLLSDTKQSKFY